MPLPDHFDLWVTRAKKSPHSIHQTDFLLASLASLPEWYFYRLDCGQLAEAQDEGKRLVLMFSHVAKAEELSVDLQLRDSRSPLPLVSMPVGSAMQWSIDLGNEGYEGLLVNPGTYGFVLSLANLKAFYEIWSRERTGEKQERQGYWISHPMSEEEDFWQENGL